MINELDENSTSCLALFANCIIMCYYVVADRLTMICGVKYFAHYCFPVPDRVVVLD